MNPLADALLTPLSNRDETVLFLPDGTKLSGRQLFETTAQYANLFAQSGVTPGDRIAIQAEKSPQALAVYLACLATGALFLPLNTAYTPHEVEYFLTDATPNLAIIDPAATKALEGVANKVGAKLLTLDQHGQGTLTQAAQSMPNQFEPIDREEDDLAVILYTSGTTGRSKGAMLSHKNLLSNAQVLAETWAFSDKDTLLHALPIYHAHGLFVAVNVSLLVGAKMIFLPKFDTLQVIKWMPNATTMMGVPTYYSRLMGNAAFDNLSTKHMRLFISGSAPLLADAHVAFEERTGHKILERYGMTETSMNASNPYDGPRKPGTVGLPLQGVNARVVDRVSGQKLPFGETGLLEISGPNVFRGYWQMPEKTAAEFRDDGYFITGDLAQIDHDGYITIIGRSKDMIISGGLNIYPKEIETILDAAKGIFESAVVGVPHDDFGEAVMAFVVLDGTKKLTHSEIRQAISPKLAGFKRPKNIAFLDELPRNAMGKVQKANLRELAKKNAAAS